MCGIYLDEMELSLTFAEGKHCVPAMLKPIGEKT